MIARTQLLNKLLIPTEEQEQLALVQWLTINNIIFYHIPNGGKRFYREGVKFKRLGVKAGVPDICIPLPRSPYHGLYIELKRHGGKLTEEQQRWLDNLNSLGYRAEMVEGCDNAIKLIQDYLSCRS